MARLFFRAAASAALGLYFFMRSKAATFAYSKKGRPCCPDIFMSKQKSTGVLEQLNLP